MKARIGAAIVSALVSGIYCSTGSGADLPPVGRSLFDHLTTRQVEGRSVQQVPYPFTALLAEIERRAGTDALGRPGLATVLIPLGRSLQRNASADAYFAHPRIVAAVTGEARGPDVTWLLRDRLFLGFQDEAGVIEVISYNEAAGRFEFQVVVDYRQGATPRVHYARRAVCSACHHAAAPIFSRPGWDETNANPVVARALSRHAERFHGVAVKRGIDVPNAIDDAVARANRLALAQTLWQQGCDAVKPPADAVACRQALLTAVLERKLPAAGRRASDPDTRALAPLLAAWKSRWPRGLLEADPNIPNRDPFFGQAQQLTAERLLPWRAEEVTPALDPMMPREPIRNWRPDPMGVQLLLHTLADFFAASDLQAIERALGQDGRESRLARATGAIAAGTRVGRTDAFASAPFRRAAVLRALAAELQIPLASTCCDAPAPTFDAPRLEGPARTPQSIPQPLAAFYRHCAACHAAAAESPPGFLHGNNLDTVERQLARCAPRIAFRLSMWARPAGERPKVPMPPPVFVPGWEQTPPRTDIEHMLDYARHAGAGQALDVLRGRGYESLPPCRELKPGASAAAVR